MDIKEIMSIIPHRQPFLLIDRVEEIVEGEKVIATKNVSYNEPFFAGHFPQEPVMPGVLIVEAMAQAGAVAILSMDEFKGKTAYFGGIKNAKFKKKVVPGDVLRLEVSIEKLKRNAGIGVGTAYVGDKVAAQAEKDKLADNDIRIPLDENSNDVTAFLAKQAVKATTKLKIRAIITDSYSGRTARNLAAFRGKYPVLAICYKEKTMRHLALSYGVEAIYMPELANGQEYYFAALRRLLQEGRLHSTDMVGYLSSGKAGTQTSFLEINVVEDALKHAQDSVLPNSNRYL